MNTWEKIVMILLAVCVAVMFAILIVFGVAAESTCDNPYAENYGQAGECTWGGMMPEWDGIPMGVCTDPNNPDYPGADYLEYLNGIGMGYTDVCGYDPEPWVEPEPEPVSMAGRASFVWREVTVKTAFVEAENVR